MRKPKSSQPSRLPEATVGKGGELHQLRSGNMPVLTTNQGIPVSDNENSLKSGARGPTLLEDFVLREKITSFDHERIPERIVHARGSAAHGYFECTESLGRYTCADFLQRPGQKTRVFVRFSTVAGGAGSVDLPRDVRGFAVKFYTDEGNFDLVGNNIPVFFIQDAMKFPDLVHSVKMEPDRGFPQSASAHDTFWDFISLMPESIHMIMWAMSDRGIPRSLRMIEGFGVHTFRLVDAKGRSTFCKFHWRPKLGLQSVVWDEAMKISGADPDFHRRDLWEAIAGGDFPEWELGLQLFNAKQAASFDFDVLDPTKLIPEEIVPLKMVGRLVLDRNPDNFFAETEQVAYCPANIVPGIDFTDDPLLQGRLFSYLDTQLSRLGGPNFHEIPINRPVCPMHNFQRDGHMRTTVPTGRVNYEPNSLGADQARPDPRKGFRTFPETDSGEKLRIRPESFADHYSQARLFFISQTPPEQDHIVSALIFELSKVETPAIRERVVSHLAHVDQRLAERVGTGLGLGKVRPATPAVPVKATVKPSPALSIIRKAEKTIKGRVIGCLVSDGADAALIETLRKSVIREGGKLKLVAPSIAGVQASNGETIAADMIIDGGPSILFDAVVVAVSAEGGKQLASNAAAVNFLRDAYGHLKVIGFVDAAEPMLAKAGIGKSDLDAGTILLANGKAVPGFIAAAKQIRIWEREKKVHPIA